jgi:hypothetical protein
METSAQGGPSRFLTLLMALAIMFSVAYSVAADELTLTIGSGTADMGAAITVPVELSSGATGPASIFLDILFDPSSAVQAAPRCAPGPYRHVGGR